VEIGRLVLDALVSGLPYALNFLGIWLVFRLLNDFDLTVDGSFTLGAATTAALVTTGWNPIAATVAAALAGGVAGLVTAFVHLKLRVILLLAGIIAWIGLYSVNLRIMGLPNISFLRHDTIFSFAASDDPVLTDLRVLALLVVLLAAVGGALGLFLKTEVGLAMRAVGANAQMARAVGVNTGLCVLVFLVLANTLVGLSGAVTAQQQYFADINMGIGVLLIGITAILLGDLFFRGRSGVWIGIIGVFVGTIVYNIAVSLAVRAGLAPTDLRAFTSAVLLIALALSVGLHWGEVNWRIRRRSEDAGDVDDGGVSYEGRAPTALVSPEPGAPPGVISGVDRPYTPRRDLAATGSSVDVKGVTVIYNRGMPNETVALRNLTLEVPAGEFLTIVGGNGAGKSTLVSLVSGSITPVSGSLLIGGRDVSREQEHHRARHIARVFQDPLAGTCPELSISENLALAASRGRRRTLRRAVTGQRRRWFEDYLAEFRLGLETRLNERVGRLSGGQRQALSILMALMNGPDVLLLDEHTAALDPRNQTLLLEITNQLVRSSNCTTLMVTHNMDQAIRYGDRMIMMNRGRIVFDAAGTKKQQLTVPRLIELFHGGSDPVITDEMALA
jgi:putative ABC transport system ATP-binding protein